MSQQLRKILSAFLILTWLVAGTTPLLAAPPSQDVADCEEQYTVLKDDWLSKLSDKYYGDVLAYTAIFEATNAAAHVDDSYWTLNDAIPIEVSQKLCIPSADEAQKLMEKWDGLQPVAQPDEQCIPIESQLVATAGPQAPYQFKDGQPFVEGEIIITGLAEDIAFVLEDPNLSDLEEIARISFEGLGQRPSTELPPPLRFPQEQLDQLTMGLYRISPPATVTQTIQAIYGVLMSMPAESPGVYPEPNYLTGQPLSSAGWDPDGSPFEGGGTAAADAFYGQWALDTVLGIGLVGPGGRTVETFGDRTQIVLMDTSMFYQPGMWEFGAPRWSEEPDGPRTMMRLCVSHPQPVYPLQSPSSYENVSHHGVFAAGLAHAVAPHSQLHLVRVLNDEGHGTLFWLADALVGVIKATVQANPDQAPWYMNNTVVNLSLGLRHTDAPGISQNELDYIQEQTELARQGLPDESQAILTQLSDVAGIPLVALETPLAIAYGYGAVIVASAGNDSGESPPNDPELPQRPASYPIPFVIGVASSDQMLGRSCFSNQGDIAAPGGGRDTNNQPVDCTPEALQIEMTSCSNPGNPKCPYGVISYSPAVTTTGYAFWTGTSFSAPQVSGLAALLLEQPDVQAQQEVYNAMEPKITPAADPNLEKGIIDVEATFAP